MSLLGIIGAMEEEVIKLKEMMTEPELIKKSGMDFYKGTIEGKNVVVVKCGVGKVNAAMCTQTMIDVFNVDSIINTGIAGSLNADINIGDIVFACDAVEHDMDVAALGYEPGIIPDTEMSVFKSDEHLLDIAKNAVKNCGLTVGVFTGRVVSGDQFISSKDKKKWLVETFDGTCAEMEGASIGHVASLNKIPYLVVRAISDKADDSATEDYPTFEAKAIAHSVKLVQAIVAGYANA